MKYSIPVFLALFTVSARAQITLEHTYQQPQFGIVEVDSAIWKYVTYNDSDSIVLFNLDHSLDRVIRVPSQFQNARLILISKQLFDLDTNYEYILALGEPSLRLLKEDGSLLFSCDSCSLGQYLTFLPDIVYARFDSPFAYYGLMSTPQGVKMIVTRGIGAGLENLRFEVYSLPGKLPGCIASSFASVTPSVAYDPSLPTSAYPNPSSGLVRIAFQLPAGVASGEVILTDEEGREVKRYRVTNAFSDLEFSEADLPSGAYFYKIVTQQGESAVQKIVRE